MSTLMQEATPGDDRLLRNALAKFCARHLKALRDQPARVPGTEEFESIVAAARSAGILTGEGGNGLLWSTDEGLRDSLTLLDMLGAQHAGIAYHLHLLALGEWLSSRIGLARGDDALVPWLPDGHRLADAAMLRFLSRGEVSPELASLLPMADETMHWSCGEPWDALFVPVVLCDAVRLCLVPRLTIIAEAPTAHGLDGVSHCRAPLPEIALAQAPPEIGPDVLAELLGLNALGLTAVALGVVRDAQLRARAQSRLRRQGGKRIEQHPAVQALLAELQSAIVVGESLLDAQTRPPHDLNALSRILAQRIVAQDLLCRAANAAMQVFGGSGYMRDMGLERAVRDVNRLRVEGGAPGDLRLFIARADLEFMA